MASTLTPKYLQIHEDLKEKILRGEYLPGAILPSQNELMETYAVAQGTVRQAMVQLQSDRLIISHRGRGTFVSELAGSGARSGDKTHVATIGLLIVSQVENDQIVTDQLFTIQNAVSQLGYELVVRIFRHEDIDGAILWASRHKGTILWGAASQDLARRLVDKGLPTVLFGELYEGDCPGELGWVHDDLEALLDTSLQLMMAMGHRRLWFVNRSSSGYFRKLTDMFERGTQRLGIADTSRVVLVEEREDEADFAQKLASMDAPPTALLIEGDIRACRFIHHLQQAGKGVPAHISVVALGAAESHRLSVNNLYRVLTQVSTGLVRSAEALVEQMDTGRIVRHVISPRLAVGTTCQAIAPSDRQG